MSLVTPKRLAKTLNLIADSEIKSVRYQDLLESGRFSELLREFKAEPDVESTSDTYTVTVDYSQFLADMIEAGGYDQMSQKITAEHFPINKRESGAVELHVVHCTRDMKTEEVLAELDKRGLRPAELPELLALGAAHPDLQRDYLLVAFGSEWYSEGDIYRPVLSSCDHERLLLLDWDDFDFEWNHGCRFVAVSK